MALHDAQAQGLDYPLYLPDIGVTEVRFENAVQLRPGYAFAIVRYGHRLYAGHLHLKKSNPKTSNLNFQKSLLSSACIPSI